MSFLKCKPSVFVINDEYEILVYCKKKGIIWVDIDGESYYESNSGVLSSEKKYAKIRVKQSVLDKAKSYTVCYRETIDRKAYFSEIGDTLSKVFKFKPLLKNKNINIYHVADVHYCFDDGVKCASYFGRKLDLLVVNGDIGEVETDKNYFEVIKFVGDVAKGEIPVIFVRGNHDTRGKLAEDFCKYFPNNDNKTYFTFSVGSLSGIVLDCGEDKHDNHKEYGGGYNGEAVYNGVNIFEKFRREETEFIKNAKLDDNKIKFAISHIIPIYTSYKAGSIFDIERDLYSEWNDLLEKMGIRFMLCGHMHKAFILNPNDGTAFINHNYPIVVGSAANYTPNGLWGAAIVLNKNTMNVKFTDKEHKVQQEFDINI